MCLGAITWLVLRKDLIQWIVDFSATHISFEALNLLNGYVQVFICVLYASIFLIKHHAMAGSIAANVESAPNRKTLQEEHESLSCCPDGATRHGSTSVNQEDILSLDAVDVFSSSVGCSLVNLMLSLLLWGSLVAD